MDTLDLLRERAEKIKAARGALENGDTQECDEKMREIRTLSNVIRKREPGWKLPEIRADVNRGAQLDRLERSLTEPLEEVEPPTAEGGGREFRNDEPEDEVRARNPETGREIRILGPRANAVKREYNLPGGLKAGDFSVGRMIRSYVTGDRRSLNEVEDRALSAGTAASGGFMLPEPAADQLIQYARDRLAVRRAGARMVAMDSLTLDMATIDSEPTGSWTAENANLTEGSMTFGRVRLSARKCGTYIKASEELVRTASNAEEQIENSLGFAVASALDSGALTGSGAAEQPLGIYNWDGVQSTDLSGVAVLPDNIITAYYSILDYNAPELGISVLYNSDVGEKIEKWQDGEGRYLVSAKDSLPACWERMNRYITNVLNTASSKADIFIGAFSELVIGYVTSGTNQGMWIDATRHTTDAFKANQIWIKALFLGDVAVTRPTWFYVIKDSGV